MTTVSYEILTVVKKTYFHKKLRAYVFRGQIIIKGMTKHNFAQLNTPVNGTMAVFPVVEHIPVQDELSATALKTRITKRMNAIKVRYEKKFQPEKESLTLKASGNYKNKLTTEMGLSQL